MRIDKSKIQKWTPGKSPKAKPDRDEVDFTAASTQKFLERIAVESTNKLVKTISDDEMEDIAETIFNLGMKACDAELYPYQESFARAIIRNVLFEKGETITALFARQSGKTEAFAVTACALAVFTPLFADKVWLVNNNLPERYADDGRIEKFRKGGFKLGVFTPSDEIGKVIKARVVEKMTSKVMDGFKKKVGLSTASNRSPLQLPNGSTIDITSAHHSAKIESRTYHLIVMEETQDINSWMIEKSIAPMGTATAATTVKIGTPNRIPGDFYLTCEANKQHDILNPSESERLHFEADYTVAAKYNHRYAQTIKKLLRETNNGETESFKLSYRLIWLVNESRFITTNKLEECGISKRKEITSNGHRFTMYDVPVSGSNVKVSDLVFSVDIGKTRDSTVVTAGSVFAEAPIKVAGVNRFRTHVLNWLELKGDDHEEQYWKIITFMSNFTKGERGIRNLTIVVDSTGKGDPVYDRFYHAIQLKQDREAYTKLGLTDRVNVKVIPFVSSAQSNSNGYTLFSEEINSGRFTYPNSPAARVKSNVVKFKSQLVTVAKEYVKGLMKVEAPSKNTNSSADTEMYRDDFVDSAMMLCAAANDLLANRVAEATMSNFSFSDLRIGTDTLKGSTLGGLRLRLRQ